MTSLVPRRSLRASRALRLLTGAALLVASCRGDELSPRGQLTLHITSDLASPKDMAQVQVEVRRTNGELLARNYYDLKPLEPGFPMPGTVAVVPPNAGGQSLLIRVSGRKLVGENPVRVVREAYVKVPTDINARLHMPLRWLCDGHTAVNEAGDVVSDCEDHQTCVAGVCQSSDVDADTLPVFTESDVFGNGNALGEGSTCLDAKLSFKDLPVKQPDQDCSLPLPEDADPGSLNVALVLEPGSEGHCLTSAEGGTCFVPFDKDPVEGFGLAGGRITLPRAVCQRIERDPTRVHGVSISTRFPTKDPSIPTCGPWLPYEPVDPQSPMGDAGSSSGGASGEGDGRAGTGPVASGGTEPGGVGESDAGAGGTTTEDGPGGTSGGTPSAGGETTSVAGGATTSGGSGGAGTGCAPYPGTVAQTSPIFTDGYGISSTETWYGAVSSHQSGGATVAPLSRDTESCFSGTEVCIAGSVPADAQSSAGIRWHMNQAEGSPEVGPVALDLAVRVHIAGARAGMRLNLVELDGAPSKFCYVLTETDAERAESEGIALFPSDFKESCWDDASMDYYPGSDIAGLEVSVPGNTAGSQTFDFCLLDVEPVFLG